MSYKLKTTNPSPKNRGRQGQAVANKGECGISTEHDTAVNRFKTLNILPCRRQTEINQNC